MNDMVGRCVSVYMMSNVTASDAQNMITNFVSAHEQLKNEYLSYHRMLEV